MKKPVIAPMSVQAGGAGGCHRPPPLPLPNFGQLRFFWAAREILAKPIFTKVSMFRFVFFFFESDIFFYLKLKQAW